MGSNVPDNTGKESNASVEVRVRAKATNAILARFADDCGGINKAAEKLGINPSTFSSWLNFRSQLFFGTKRVGAASSKRAKRIIRTLETETGRNIRDIFPLSKAQMRLLEKPRVVEKTIERDELIRLDYAKHKQAQLTFKEPSPHWELPEAIKQAIQQLPSREKLVLELRFGLNDGQNLTLDEVGKIMHVQKERVRQIEARALRRLEASDSTQGLLDFLD